MNLRHSGPLCPSVPPMPCILPLCPSVPPMPCVLPLCPSVPPMPCILPLCPSVPPMPCVLPLCPLVLPLCLVSCHYALQFPLCLVSCHYALQFFLYALCLATMPFSSSSMPCVLLIMPSLCPPYALPRPSLCLITGSWLLSQTNILWSCLQSWENPAMYS